MVTMRIVGSLLIAAVLAVDAFIPSKKSSRFFAFGRLAAEKKPNAPFFLDDGTQKEPQPPDIPPPPKQQPYKPRPTFSLTELMNEDTREKLQTVGDTLKKELVVRDIVL